MVTYDHQGYNTHLRLVGWSSFARSSFVKWRSKSLGYTSLRNSGPRAQTSTRGSSNNGRGGNVAAWGHRKRRSKMLSAKRCPGRDGKREFDRWICGARSFGQLHWMALIRHQRCADKRAVCSCSFCHVCFSHVKKCCSKYVPAISGLSTWLLLTSAHVVWRYPEDFTGQALELWFHRRRDAGLTPGVQHQMEHFLRPPEICMPIPIGSMYGTYANIWGILMVNVTIYSIHGSYGI
jgi:hypothetical protein